MSEKKRKTATKTGSRPSAKATAAGKVTAKKRSGSKGTVSKGSSKPKPGVKAKPVVSKAKPVAKAKSVSKAKPVIKAKSVSKVKPVVKAKPVSKVKPVAKAKPAAASKAAAGPAKTKAPLAPRRAAPKAAPKASVSLGTVEAAAAPAAVAATVETSSSPAEETASPALELERGEARTSHRIQLELDGTTLEIIDGDITEVEVEALVNPANENLQLGTGVAGAILAKGGATIQEECDRIGHIAVGTAVMTGAGRLKAKQVIHAVGPRWGEGDEDRKLSSAVRSAMALADRNGLRSLALPAISTGNFGFPLERAARIMLTEIHRYLQGGTKLHRVVLCLFGEEAFNTFRRELRRGFR